MNCGQLIDELRQVSPELPVVFPDSEDGYRNVGVVAITRMSIFSDPTFTYDKVDKGYVNQQALPTTLVAILEERR